MVDRREALASLASIVTATGMTVAPITTKEAEPVTMVIFRAKSRLSHEQQVRFRDYWLMAAEGTALEGVKAVVLDDGIEIELVRG